MPDRADTLRTIRRDLREEYLQPHDWPWMIGFSGGKDSTFIFHPVIECLRISRRTNAAAGFQASHA